MVQKIKLNKDQLKEVRKIRGKITSKPQPPCTFAKYPGCLNSSYTGAGKTPFSIDIGLKGWMDTEGYVRAFEGIVVVAPLAALSDGWITEPKKYGANIINKMGYAALRAQKKDKSSSCEYLMKIYDEKIVRGDKGSYYYDTYYPTKKLKKLLRRGILWVFDESHNGRNDTAQYKTIRCITTCIKQLMMEEDCNSRFILLSATPCTKDEGVARYLKMFGLYESLTLTTNDNEDGRFTSVPTGILDLVQVGKDLNEPIMDEILLEFGYNNKKNAEELCREIMRQILVPELVTWMPLPKTEYVNDMCNGLYTITDKLCNFVIAEAVSKIEMALNPYANGGLDNLVLDEDILAILNKMFQIIQINLTKTVQKAVIKELEDNKNGKVIVVFEYTEPLLKLKEKLEKEGYEVLILNESVKKKDRRKVIKRFQDKDLKYRVLLMNLTVGAEGINLHDIHGNRPRTMFITLGLKVVSLIQATGRIERVGTKSNMKTRIVYPRGSTIIPTVFNILARRCDIINIFLPSYGLPKKYPKEYPTIIIDKKGNEIRDVDPEIRAEHL